MVCVYVDVLPILTQGRHRADHFRLPGLGRFRQCMLHLRLGKDRCPLILQMCYQSNCTYIRVWKCLNKWLNFFSTLFLNILVSWIPVHSQFVSFLIFITILRILLPTIYIIMSYHSIFQRWFVFKG